MSVDLWTDACGNCLAKGNYEYCEHLCESEECPKHLESEDQ